MGAAAFGVQSGLRPNPGGTRPFKGWPFVGTRAEQEQRKGEKKQQQRCHWLEKITKGSSSSSSSSSSRGKKAATLPLARQEQQQQQQRQQQRQQERMEQEASRQPAIGWGLGF